MAEFSAAFMLLTLMVIPLLDLGVLPVRWILAQEIINSETRRLAQCKTFGQTADFLNSNSTLKTQLEKIGGVELKSVEPRLVMSMTQPPYESFEAADAKSIPPEWLPNGKKSPCKYEFELVSSVDFSPLITLNCLNIDIPGLGKPFNVTIKAIALWENYGRDPITRQFYMAE